MMIRGLKDSKISDFSLIYNYRLKDWKTGVLSPESFNI